MYQWDSLVPVVCVSVCISPSLVLSIRFNTGKVFFCFGGPFIHHQTVTQRQPPAHQILSPLKNVPILAMGHGQVDWGRMHRWPSRTRVLVVPGPDAAIQTQAPSTCAKVEVVQPTTTSPTLTTSSCERPREPAVPATATTGHTGRPHARGPNVLLFQDDDDDSLVLKLSSDKAQLFILC